MQALIKPQSLSGQDTIFALVHWDNITSPLNTYCIIKINSVTRHYSKHECTVQGAVVHPTTKIDVVGCVLLTDKHPIYLLKRNGREVPKVGTLWRHHRGQLYVVTGYSINQVGQPTVKYCPVISQDADISLPPTGVEYCQQVDSWLETVYKPEENAHVRRFSPVDIK